MKARPLGLPHSGDIAPTSAGGQGRVGAKGEIEEGAETKVPECAVELGAVLEGTASRGARSQGRGGATVSRLDTATEATVLLQGQAG